MPGEKLCPGKNYAWGKTMPGENYAWGKTMPGEKLCPGKNYAWGKTMPGEKLCPGKNYARGKTMPGEKRPHSHYKFDAATMSCVIVQELFNAPHQTDFLQALRV